MLPKPYDHQEYLRQIQSSEAVAAMVTSPNAQVRELGDRLLRLVAAADPSSFHPGIRSWYAPTGRPPNGPYRIMRSLLLMIHLGHGSVRDREPGRRLLRRRPLPRSLGGQRPRSPDLRPRQGALRLPPPLCRPGRPLRLGLQPRGHFLRSPHGYHRCPGSLRAPASLPALPPGQPP